MPYSIQPESNNSELDPFRLNNSEKPTFIIRQTVNVSIDVLWLQYTKPPPGGASHSRRVRVTAARARVRVNE